MKSNTCKLCGTQTYRDNGFTICKVCHSKCHEIIPDMYTMSDDDFKDAMVKRRYRQGKITKEEAFVELV